MQYPVEVPGVPLEAVLASALESRGEARADLHDRILVEARSGRAFPTSSSAAG